MTMTPVKPKAFTRYKTRCGFEAEVYRTITDHWTTSTNYGQAIGALRLPVHPAVFPGWQECSWGYATGSHKSNEAWDLVQELGPVESDETKERINWLKSAVSELGGLLNIARGLDPGHDIPIRAIEIPPTPYGLMGEACGVLGQVIRESCNNPDAQVNLATLLAAKEIIKKFEAWQRANTR